MCGCQSKGSEVGGVDRRAREADERRVGQGVAQVPRETVDEVVLAAVRLVGDHDHVGTRAQQRACVGARALRAREELVHRGEHHAPRRDAEQLAQVRPVARLLGRLA
jgi:hypothetical protein